MAEAVILSAIESLDSWLLEKPDLWEDNFEKLYSLVVGMADFGEDKKEILHSLLFGMADSWKNYENSSWWEEDDWERNKEKLYRLVDLREDNKEKMHSLVVGMADFWEDNKEKLYCLLFRVADLWKEYKDKINRIRSPTLTQITGLWRDDKGTLNTAVIYNLLVEITDLWGDDEGKLNKEKLHSLLFKMLVYRKHYDTMSYKKNMCRITVEMAGLWKDKQPKLNKEKLYSWLANKADLCEGEYLFGLLLDMARHQQNGTDDHKSTREGVEGVRNDLRLILDFITGKKLEEEKEEGSSSLRYFISDVVDMAHDAQFLVQLKDSDPCALFLELLVLHDRKFSSGHAYWFLTKLTPIVDRLREMRVSMLEFGVERSQNVEELEGGEDVVGLEEDVKLLLHDEDIGATTFIKGMAGIGKTTLARQLYNHTTIAHQFKCRAWVCLSRVFSRSEILMSLLRQVVDSKELASLEKMEHADYKSLKQVLHQHLKGMRYFIVLDDVWEYTTYLKYVMKALPKDKGSRLLLTTRSVIIQIDHREDYDHKMKFMDDDKSWTLLLKTLFFEGSDQEFPKHLEEKARQILRKCNGLPLAIKEVGRQWAKERQSGSEWEELVESIDLTETLVTLESSYHNLAPELKSCFLHLGFFKEGTTIRAKKLIQIWIIGGVVSQLEELYQQCLHKLSEQSIIEVKDMDNVNERIKTCRIHSIFHRLSITKAEDEMSFEILRKDGNNRPSHEPRHRAIYCSREKLMNYSSNQDKHLVSLFFYGGGYFDASPSYWKHFEQLKTLDMEDFGLKILPDAVGTLIELRYLGLRNNYIQELPHSLGRLKNLEVLDIALNFMVEVPDIIWGMYSLRQLYMSGMSCEKPLKIDALKNLRTLTYITVDSWTYELSRLKMMTSLLRLGIEGVDGKSDVRMLFASLAELENLGFLTLRGFRFRSMPSLDELGILRNLSKLKLDGLLTRLPSANNFPPYITCLSLVNSCLDEDPMPILEKLSSDLYYLKLQNAYIGQQMVISPDRFPRLRYLVIRELWHLRNVQVGKGAMPLLRELEINSCPYLETLPEDILPMDGPKKFKMKTTKKIATKIRESGFISRISEVDIQP